MKACPVCGREYPDTYLYCQTDAEALVTVATAPADYPSASGDQPVRNRLGGPQTPVIAAGALAGLCILALIGRSLFSSPSSTHRSSNPPPPIPGSTAGGTSGVGTLSSTSATTGSSSIPSAPAVSSEPPSAWTSHTVGNDFSTEFPQGWTVTPKRGLPEPRVLFGDANDAHRMIVDVQIEKVKDPLVDAKYWDHTFQKQHGDQYHLVSIERSTVDGHAAATWVSTQRKKDGSGEVGIRSTYFYSGRRLFTVMLRTPQEQSESWKPTYDHILSSCRFTH